MLPILLSLGLFLGAPALGVSPEAATASGAPDEGNPRVEATLLTDVSAVKPGEAFRVGVRFRMDPGWHVYWKNPGDSGLATELSWDAPGTTLGSLQWPYPETFRTPDGYIVTHGYADEVLLFTDAKASAQATGELRLSAIANVLVCEVHCIPAELTLTRALPTGRETRVDAESKRVFDASAARVPGTLEAARAEAAVTLEAKTLAAGKPFRGELRLTGAVVGEGDDFFVPERIEGLEKLSLTRVAGQPGLFTVGGEASPDAPQADPRLRGVMRLQGDRAVALDVPLAPFAPATKPVVAAAAPAPRAEPLSLGLVLLFALAGGALLNLMPCVFPVLALKAYGFSRMVREERGRVGLHAFAYALGIEVSMLALAGAVLAVRAAGREVGWGFQFQEPLFVAAVSGVLVAFALNLFGVFEVGADATALAGKVDASHGVGRSFGEGVLAVVLATPCSAPLLGTAVGFALAAGAGTVVAVFLLLGFGLALPFCILVLVPGLAKKLPRPGAWMEHGKQLLGFALLGTVVWLVWVAGGLAGVDGMARLLGFLVAVALAAWVWGRVQSAARGKRLLGALFAAAWVVAVGAVALRFTERAPDGLSSTLSQAQAWDESKVAAALKSGRPVFIDFTADWCLTCKFNERTVLSQDVVREALEKHRVAVFVADWTRRDARIREKLAAHGRAGVPMYLMIHPGRPDAPEVLPELLTGASVVEAVERAARPLPDAT